MNLYHFQCIAPFLLGVAGCMVVYIVLYFRGYFK